MSEGQVSEFFHTRCHIFSLGQISDLLSSPCRQMSRCCEARSSLMKRKVQAFETSPPLKIPRTPPPVPHDLWFNASSCGCCSNFSLSTCNLSIGALTMKTPYLTTEDRSFDLVSTLLKLWYFKSMRGEGRGEGTELISSGISTTGWRTITYQAW